MNYCDYNGEECIACGECSNTNDYKKRAIKAEAQVKKYQEAVIGICAFCDHNPNACTGMDDRFDCPDDLSWELCKELIVNNIRRK